MSCRIRSRQMAIHLCGSFNVSLSQHLMYISCHFISCMGPDMCLQKGSLVKYIVTFWKGKWLFYHVDPRQMSCHIWRRHMAFHLCGSFNAYLECHWLNVFSHLNQTKGFFPVWILSCIFISPLVLNASCFLELPFPSNILHLEQAFGFLPVCILSCQLRVSLTKSTFTFDAGKRLLPCICPFMSIYFTDYLKCLVTFGARKWLLSCVCSVRFLQLFSMWVFSCIFN